MAKNDLKIYYGMSPEQFEQVTGRKIQDLSENEYLQLEKAGMFGKVANQAIVDNKKGVIHDYSNKEYYDMLPKEGDKAFAHYVTSSKTGSNHNPLKRSVRMFNPIYDTSALGKFLYKYNSDSSTQSTKGLALIGGAIPMVGSAVFSPLSFFTNPAVYGYFSYEGGKNLLSDEGIKKTYNLGKDLVYDDPFWNYNPYRQNSNAKRFWNLGKSALGDALDAAFVYGGAQSAVKGGLKTASWLGSQKAKTILRNKELEKFAADLYKGEYDRSKLFTKLWLKENLSPKAIPTVAGEIEQGIPYLRWSPKGNYFSETADPKGFTTAKSNVGSTSLAFYQRPTSRITLAERLGIPKGDRGNLTKFQKDALEDLNQYINSGQYRQFPTINMDTAEPFWGTRGNPPAIQQLIEDGVPSVRGRGREWQWNRPNGGTYELVTDGNGNFGIGYSSYRMFDVSPEFNARVGEASAGSARNGYSKIFLTAPRNDAMHFITETPEQESAKKILIETQSPRINKDIMRDFWSGVQQSLRPGAYLSGDEGMLPKGATLIELFKGLSKKAYRRDNNRNIIGSGRTNWEDIRNYLMRTEKWKKRPEGLSTDSYLALLKQANRKNSPYSLRYSPDGFTTFNGQSIDNKFISDLLEKTKRGESTQQEFLDAFHKWVSPYGGMDAKIVNGEIIIPHPFLYKKKQGGKFKYYVNN